MKVYRRKAPAKVNLALEVLGKREDGFHELRTIFDALEFGDELQFTPQEGRGFSLSILGESVPQGLPSDERNLVLKAAQAYRRAFPGTMGGAFVLNKVVPIGAGLGGGSSDAAQALLLLEEAEQGEGFCSEGRDPEVLKKIAASLGADLPFFLEGGRAFAEGRGDRILAMDADPTLHYILLFPGVHCETAAVFAQYQRGLTESHSRLGSSLGRHPCQDASNQDHPSSSQSLARVFTQDSSMAVFSQIASQGSEAPTFGSNAPFLANLEIAKAYLHWVLNSDASVGPLTRLFNDLRLAALQEYPELEVIPRVLQELGFPSPQFSGSGSTFFLAFREKEACDSMARDLASQLGKCSPAKKNLISIVTTRSVFRLL